MDQDAFKRAIECYKLAVDQGHADAQFNLGVMYVNGDGIEQSYSKAREWWTKAAAQGRENAIHNLKWTKKGKSWAMQLLAQRYSSNGQGVKQSDKKAIELYEMAAKGGHAMAQANLGLYYNQGMHGLAQSSKNGDIFWIFFKARELWTKAAAQGIK